MIIFLPINLKDLSTLKKKYPWPNPGQCPRCKRHKIWGHGFQTSLFDGFPEPLPLKRYLCPDCKSIVKIRPDGYFKCFQASVDAIRKSIATKAENGKWLPHLLRSRQNHWFQALKKNTAALIGVSFTVGLLAFETILSMGINPVSRSI